MKAIFYIMAIISICLLCSCDKDIYADIEIQNETDESVMIIDGVVTYDYEVFQPNELYDWYLKEYLDTIRPHEKYTRHVLIKNYDGLIYDNGRHLQYLLWKQSTLEKFTLDEIVLKNIYDKRYKFSEADLRANNAKVVYTGK